MNTRLLTPAELAEIYPPKPRNFWPLVIAMALALGLALYLNTEARTDITLGQAQIYRSM